MQHCPNWMHPRFPLVANEVRTFRPVDFRIVQLSTRFLAVAPIISALLFLGVLGSILADGKLFGFLLFPVAVLVVPANLVFAEFLRLRVLVSIPSHSAQMIAGEIERGTWDPLLTTPIPRHHIILSKFSAILWNNSHAIGSMLIAQGVIAAFVLTEGLILGAESFSAHSLPILLLISLLIIFLPFFEIMAVAAMGLLISLLMGAPTPSNTFTWGAWLTYRICTGLFFLVAMVGTPKGILVWLGLSLGLPYWLHLYVWVESGSLADLEQFSLLISILYLLLPSLLTMISLALTIGMVQYQGNYARPRKPDY